MRAMPLPAVVFENASPRSISAVNLIPNPSPSPKLFAALRQSFAIHLAGADAAKVINNLSTNDVSKLAVGASCETFVTDARGWIVAHAGVVKREDEAWLLGSHPSPAAIAKHLDRYIIREAAVVSDHSAELALFAVHDSPPGQADARAPGGASMGAASSASTDSSQALIESLQLARVSPSIFASWLPIWGPGTSLLCCPREQAAELRQRLEAHDFAECAGEQFEWLRISGFWPLPPADIGDKTIPQELDRDQQAISFTKGCYLGQETIARLDARGQLQKKLCLIELDAAGQYAVGDAFRNVDKEVGKITSLARDPVSEQVRALAYLRRGNFETGTRLSCNELVASVLR